MLRFLLACALFSSGARAAAWPPLPPGAPVPLVDGGASLRLPPKLPVLLVTHASRFFDKDALAKEGIDRAVAAFKRRGWPVVYLVRCAGEPGTELYSEDPSPTAKVCSSAGEHSMDLSGRPLYIAGGLFELCSMSTMMDGLVSQIRLAAAAEVEIHYLVDAVYTFETGDKTFADLLSRPDGLKRAMTHWRFLHEIIRDDERSRGLPLSALGFRIRLGDAEIGSIPSPYSGRPVAVTLHLQGSREL